MSAAFHHVYNFNWPERLPKIKMGTILKFLFWMLLHYFIRHWLYTNWMSGNGNEIGKTCYLILSRMYTLSLRGYSLTDCDRVLEKKLKGYWTFERERTKWKKDKSGNRQCYVVVFNYCRLEKPARFDPISVETVETIDGIAILNSMLPAAIGNNNNLFSSFGTTCARLSVTGPSLCLSGQKD